MRTEKKVTASPLERFLLHWWTAGALTAALIGILSFNSSGFSVTAIIISGAVSAAAALPLPTRPLRVIRLVSGGTAAAAGALLIPQLHMTSQNPSQAGSQAGAALLFSFVLAGVGAWIADVQIAARLDRDQAERDRLAAERHAELVERLGPRPVRARDAFWVLPALLFVWRRRI
ncbi:hypothetical protein [Cellulomonas cellasea]|uniref:Uncharacterized protein n=1 Tax=Cellulomonas cellasea TaxID=43670 RepID=A0A7W4UH70_9CELL|nr:hypothetical protein [Cellulomonas cellasea]MBB2924102.1 hypothetical protein [Cellulomonas cellasea]